MQMAFLEPKIQFLKTVEDYKKPRFSFDSKKIHLIDQTNLHKKAEEIIYSTLTTSTMEKYNLQVSLSNIQSQLKMEKISSLAKDTKIKYLEDLVVKLGYAPKNVKVSEEMIKRKNADIRALRKQLKLATTEDPQTNEIGELEKEKENMLKIIIEHNTQIQKMETKLETLLNEKEQQATQTAITPLAAIPITGISIGGASTLAENIQSTDLPTNLAKAMGDLSLRREEIEKLKSQLHNLQEQKLKIDNAYVAEI